MIRRGQGISGRFDGETGTQMPIAASEMSLHHTDLVHASLAAFRALQDAGFFRTLGAAGMP